MNISADILIGRLSRPARDVLLSMDYNDVVPATGNVVVNLRRLDIARWSEDGEFRLTERGRDVKGTLHAQREQREAATDYNTAKIVIDQLTSEARDVLLGIDYYDAISTSGRVVKHLSGLDLARWSEDAEFRLTERGRDVKEALHVQKQAQREMAAVVWWGRKPAQATKSSIGTSRQYLVHETEDFGETWKKHDVTFTSERQATEYAKRHISEWGGTLRVVEKFSEYRATEWIYQA